MVVDVGEGEYWNVRRFCKDLRLFGREGEMCFSMGYCLKCVGQMNGVRISLCGLDGVHESIK